MIKEIKEIISVSLNTVFEAEEKVSIHEEEISVEETKDEKFGDFTTNIAMKLASGLKKNPRQIAEKLVGNIKADDQIFKKVEIAGPGFINFYMTEGFWHTLFKEILKKKDVYGFSDFGKNKKVLVEFVSANPTGPLHVGHGRGAVVGDTLSRIMKAAGFLVTKEYYVNDKGNQMNNLGKSTFCRYKELNGVSSDLSEDGYKGDYIYDIAKEVIKEKGDTLMNVDEEEALKFFTKFSRENILKSIEDDLSACDISFDNWYSELSLFDSGKVKSALNTLKEKGVTYSEGGALWFKTKDYGDEKDRVVIKENGDYTYFSSDISYHKDKYDRGFDKIIDIWGADHHGYVPRIKASLNALGINDDFLKVMLIQFVSLKSKDDLISMSTREGKFVTFKAVIDEVGKDAVRFFFLMRSTDSHLDFDMELAKEKSKDNPVYYVQYAHARIQSVFRNAKNLEFIVPDVGNGEMSLLNLPEEIQLIKKACQYPDIVKDAADLMEPHKIIYFLSELAALFHSYYNKNKIILEDNVELTNARLLLALGVQMVLKNALNLLGVTPLDKM